MKKIILSIILFSLSSAYAANEGSLDCSFTKNNSEKIELSFERGSDYVEEQTELYFGSKDGVVASVIYLPYQYGILLSLNAEESMSEANGENNISTKLEQNNETYSLSCFLK